MVQPTCTVYRRSGCFDTNIFTGKEALEVLSAGASVAQVRLPQPSRRFCFVAAERFSEYRCIQRWSTGESELATESKQNSAKR